jgi:hypothetical protein
MVGEPADIDLNHLNLLGSMVSSFRQRRSPRVVL